MRSRDLFDKHRRSSLEHPKKFSCLICRQAFLDSNPPRGVNECLFTTPDGVPAFAEMLGRSCETSPKDCHVGNKGSPVLLLRVSSA
jgi:hypothetical protein